MHVRTARCFSPPDRLNSFRSSKCSVPITCADNCARSRMRSAGTRIFSMQKYSSSRSVAMQNCRSGFWNIIEIFSARSLGFSSFSGVPNSSIEPSVKKPPFSGSNPHRIAASVLFPQPLLPIRTVISPDGMVSDTLSITGLDFSK